MTSTQYPEPSRLNLDYLLLTAAPPLATAPCCPLQAGYAVIFLTRTGSLQPFAHMLPAADPPELVDTVMCLADESAGGPNLMDQDENL